MILGMTVGYFILGVLSVIICVALIVIILMQDKRTAGLGSGMSGMGGSQTYWDKNKGRSFEGALERYSKILGGAFMLLSLIICLVK